jgi:hypothetical protein
MNPIWDEETGHGFLPIWPNNADGLLHELLCLIRLEKPKPFMKGPNSREQSSFLWVFIFLEWSYSIRRILHLCCEKATDAPREQHGRSSGAHFPNYQWPVVGR